MVFEKKMSVKDLIEQMREELNKEQDDAGLPRAPTHKKATKKAVKAKAKPAKKAKKKKR